MLATGALTLSLALAGGQSDIALGAMEATMGPAEEQDLPAGTVTQDPATSGSTEIAEQGKFAAASVDDRNADDATELEIAAGGVLSTGNARAFQGTATGRFRLRRGRHQAGAAFAGNYGRAAADADSDVETTVSNVQGMARYDFFFAKRWSAFFMVTARNDRFQGLDLRLNIDPGIAFYALTNPKHRLWFELGYDFQYDDRRRDSIFGDVPVDPSDPEGETMRVQLVDERATNHAVRLFAGYSNQLSDLVSFDTGLEYLQSVIDAGRIRVNWINALTATLGDRLGIATTFTLRYENEPLPDVVKLDTITAILLTVKFI